MEFLKILKKHSYYGEKINLKLNSIKKELSDDELMIYLIKQLHKLDKHFYIINKEDLLQGNIDIKYEQPQAIFKNNTLTLIVPRLVGF